MLGGTIWKLVKDETSIIYAVDFNSKKSRHLNGATFDACIRPRLLLIDVSNALYTHVSFFPGMNYSFRPDAKKEKNGCGN